MSQLQKISDHLYSYADTCNVYVLRSEDAALLIDCGSGSVVEELAGIGCTQLEWVLHTHHHRDQCWGSMRAVQAGARVAVPEYERHLFEKAGLFWQTRRIFDNYDDRNNFFTLAENLPVHAVLQDYEEFHWRGYSFYVLPAKGHTPGSAALVAVVDGSLCVFTGDLIMRGGLLYQLHAMEYTYSDMVGALFTLQSIQALRDVLRGELVAGRVHPRFGAARLLPSHGEAIDEPLHDIDRLEGSLLQLAALGRGIRFGGRDSIPEPLYVPEPRFVELSPHLLWSGPTACSYFYVILSASGKALLIDYGQAFPPHMHNFADHNGLDTLRFVEHSLKSLRRDYGVEAIDVVVPTHIHDDHTCGIPHLQRHYGTRCWALDTVAEVLREPAAWASTPCLYHKPVRIDRALADGEQFQWEEHTLASYFAPGQTEYHSVIAAWIDGQTVAFSGDNWLVHDVHAGGRTEPHPFQTTVLRNSFQLEMHRRCRAVMDKIRPTLICPGHWGVWPCTERDLREYSSFITRKERVFRRLVGEPADHFIDLFWVRMSPYLAEFEPGAHVEYRLLLRNNFGHAVTYEARLLPPRDWQVSPDFASITLAAGAHAVLAIPAQTPPAGDDVRRLITAEIRIDGRSQGPVAEALCTVRSQRRI